MSVLIHDNADKVPPPAPGRHPLTPISGADFERRSGGRIPAQAWLIISVAALAPVGLLLWGVYSAVQSLLLDAPWLGSVIGALLLVAALLTALGLITTLSARAWLGVQQARVVRTRHGVPVDVVAQMRLDPLLLEAQAVQLELARAPYLQHPNLSTLSSSGGAKAEAPAQLAAPTIDLVPDSEWLPWLGDAPHGMIAGSTGSGKSTFARLALRQALEVGARGCIVDPKGKDWYGLPVVGAGRQFEPILQALDGVRAELEARYLAYGGGVRDFDPIVVLVDEVPDIMDSCRNERGSVSDARWSQFARSLGSLAREVQIRVVLLTQSPNVEDIGMNSGMRSNYTRIALREKIPLLINEDVDPARREQLRRLYSGQKHPAAIYRDGQVHLLDTRRVVELAAQPVQGARGWQPTLVLRNDADAITRKAIRAAIVRGMRRDEVRAAGLRFDNGLWSELAAELDQAA